MIRRTRRYESFEESHEVASSVEGKGCKPLDYYVNDRRKERCLACHRNVNPRLTERRKKGKGVGVGGGVGGQEEGEARGDESRRSADSRSKILNNKRCHWLKSSGLGLGLGGHAPPHPRIPARRGFPHLLPSARPHREKSTFAARCAPAEWRNWVTRMSQLEIKMRGSIKRCRLPNWGREAPLLFVPVIGTGDAPPHCSRCSRCSRCSIRRDSRTSGDLARVGGSLS
jgi:hypothetical protein